MYRYSDLVGSWYCLKCNTLLWAAHYQFFLYVLQSLSEPIAVLFLLSSWCPYHKYPARQGLVSARPSETFPTCQGLLNPSPSFHMPVAWAGLSYVQKLLGQNLPKVPQTAETTGYLIQFWPPFISIWISKEGGKQRWGEGKCAGRQRAELSCSNPRRVTPS